MEHEKVLLTREGVELLQNELQKLKEVDRKEVINELKEARAQGDLSENADYDAARNRQAQVESRITELENMLANAKIIDDKTKGAPRVVRLGTTVTIRDLTDNEEYKYTIVGPVEANPLNGKISNEAPLAQAILNHGIGARVSVMVKEPYDVEILNIER